MKIILVGIPTLEDAQRMQSEALASLQTKVDRLTELHQLADSQNAAAQAEPDDQGRLALDDEYRETVRLIERCTGDVPALSAAVTASEGIVLQARYLHSERLRRANQKRFVDLQQQRTDLLSERAALDERLAAVNTEIAGVDSALTHGVHYMGTMAQQARDFHGVPDLFAKVRAQLDAEA